MKSTTRFLCFSAIIATIYAVLTIVLAPISYGAIQLRVAEALTILPFVLPFATWGIFVGCVIANTLYGIYDIVFGSLITLIAGYLTSKIKNMWLAPLPPIVLNALFLPMIWYFLGTEEVYWFNVLSIACSQTIVLYALGIPLLLLVKKTIIPAFFNDDVVIKLENSEKIDKNNEKSDKKTQKTTKNNAKKAQKLCKKSTKIMQKSTKMI